jgi:LAS superfamily LD-carboxypeptidase LdcB/murein DD-endopeptidase MepM/ murein hydrolase activator NlpD
MSLRIKLRRLLLAFLIFLVCFFQFAPFALADMSADPAFQTTTFNNMPTFSDKGTGILDDPTVLSNISYNPSRSWSVGSKPADVVLIGDLYTFGAGELSVQQILGNQTDISNVSLSEFSAINGVSLEDLTTGIPGLAEKPVSAVPALNALQLGTNGNYQQGITAAVSEYLPGAKEFLAKNPWASQIPLNSIVNGDWNGALGAGAKIGIDKLVKAYPNLKNVPLGDLAGNVLSGDWRGAIKTGINYGIKYGSEYLVKDLLKDNPALKDIPIGELLDTRNLSINSIPGLATTAIGRIPGLGNQTISSIPGLGNIPVKDLIGLGDLLRFGIAKVDIPFGSEKEGKALYTISGSTKDDNFKPEPCVGKCPNFELADGKTVFGQTLKGRQWVTKDQQVPGGRGILAKVNKGKEPTGLTPWGAKPNIKLVIESISEKKSEATLSLYLRVCVKTIWVDFGCTPYFVGPIPFGTVKEKGSVIIATSAAPPLSYPTQGGGTGASANNCAIPATQKTKYGYKAYPGANPNELVSVPTNMDRTEMLQTDAAASFQRMRQAAAAQGIDLSVISGHRSYEVQQQLWNDQVARRGSEPEAAKVSAPPGYSEHQTGYALDISQAGTGTDLSQSFQNTSGYAWLKQNAGKYGFVQSYTGEASQGADNEPWHWRYQGTQAAKDTFAPPPSTAGAYPCSSSAGSNSDCSIYKGVQVGSFKDAIAKIESAGQGYSAVGPMLPPAGSDPHYQVALGKYQFMSFRPEVISEVTKNKGYGWLQSIWSGRTPTAAEVNQYFPPDVQEQVMSKESKSLVDQAQQRGARANDLVRTAAMIHNGGYGFNPNSSWTPGGLTVGEYGADVLKTYGSVLPKNQAKCQSSAGSASSGTSGTTGKFSSPVPGSVVTEEYLTGSNNWRGRPHKGMDLAGVATGTPVGAVDGGTVALVSNDPDGFGNFVLVDHGNGFASLYGHLNSTSVTAGQTINKGDSVGGLGSTGRSTGPHLHLELIKNYRSGDVYSGDNVNPRDYISF